MQVITGCFAWDQGKPDRCSKVPVGVGLERVNRADTIVQPTHFNNLPHTHTRSRPHFPVSGHVARRSDIMFRTFRNL